MNAKRIVGVLLVLVGAVWFLQGIGVIGGSFMTDNPTWIWIGALVALGGVILATRR